MSFGNVAVFPFPAVQYIPLTLTMLRQNRFGDLNLQPATPQLIVGPKVQNWLRVLDPASTGADPICFPPDSFPLLALNLQIEDVKYRSHLVTMLGRAEPGFYQLAVIPGQYFYKDTLFFELYDSATSQRLARSERCEVGNGK
jgi:hypothetical protein